MSDAEKHQTIRIIKKKGRGHEGSHGGAWKVAYADFVTAMMALFIVLWIVGQNKPVKEAIAAYFRDPGAIHRMTKGSDGIMPGGKTIKVLPDLKQPERSDRGGGGAAQVRRRETGQNHRVDARIRPP